jgi:phage minor structural protein
LVKVYDYGVSTSNPVAILNNAYAIGYEKRMNEIWTAQFTLPADDPKNAYCLPFKYVEIFDNGERVELFRILPSRYVKNAESKTKTYQCEHVLSTLLDDILFQYHQTTGLSPEDNIDYILGFQSMERWQVGTVGFSDVYDYKWENENLLSSLFSLPKAYSSEYQWTFDTTSYPWTLNLIQPSTTPTARIMGSKNLVDLSGEDDPTYVITRLYPLGYGEGVNQLTIKDVNGGVPYVESDTVGTYGIISVPFVDKTEENAETLKAKALAYLETVKIPRRTWEVNAADIYPITGKSLDNIREVGSMVAVYDEDVVAFAARIVYVSKSDVTGAPGDIRVQISNKILDAADTTTSLLNRQRITDVYAQGATNIDSNDYQDNCDSDHPATVWFYIPTECVNVNKCALTYKTGNFRAYERAIEAAPAVTSGASSKVTTDSGGGSFPTSDVQIFAPGVSNEYTVEGGDPSHTHDLYNHKHEIEIDNHSHGMEHTHIIPEHTHEIEHGIFEYDDIASSVTVKVDGNAVSGLTSTSTTDYSIVNYLDKDSNGKILRGWHKVEITPNDLARITAAVTKQIFVQSRGGGDY